MEEDVKKEEFVNPRNGIGEFLYYELENVKDEEVEGRVLFSGFNNGMGTVPLKKD